jgi:hypothetical protein
LAAVRFVFFWSEPGIEPLAGIDYGGAERKTRMRDIPEEAITEMGCDGEVPWVITPLSFSVYFIDSKCVFVNGDYACFAPSHHGGSRGYPAPSTCKARTVRMISCVLRQMRIFARNDAAIRRVFAFPLTFSEDFPPCGINHYLRDSPGLAF